MMAISNVVGAVIVASDGLVGMDEYAYNVIFLP
jgi:hypothetical protein